MHPLPNGLTTASMASIAFAALCMLAPTQATAQTSVIIQSDAASYQMIPAPPPPRYEPMPQARHGQIWVAGHWEWRGHNHHWVPGHWEHVRPGHSYHPPQWREYDGRWQMHHGGWERGQHRDRDGDGIPNYRDRDRDGDGIPNYRDHHPNNPHRR